MKILENNISGKKISLMVHTSCLVSNVAFMTQTEDVSLRIFETVLWRVTVLTLLITSAQFDVFF